MHDRVLQKQIWRVEDKTAVQQKPHHNMVCACHDNGEQRLVNVQANSQGLNIGTYKLQ